MLRRIMLAAGEDFAPPEWPSATVFPSIIPGLVARYAADFLSLADGARVATWPDASGHGYDLVQSSTEKQPIYRAAGFSGLPVVEFDGVDDFMTRAFGTAYAQPNTVIMLADIPAGGAGYADARAWFDGHTETERHWLGHTTNSKVGIWAGGSFLHSGASNVPGLLLVRGHYQSSAAVYVGGVFKGAASNIGTQALGGVTLGSRWDGLRNTNVMIHEVMVFDRILSTAELEQLEEYQMLKARRAPVSFRGSLGSGEKWAYAVRSSVNGHIYGAPYRNSQLLKINTTTGAVAGFGNYGSGNDSWLGTIEAPNGFIYGVPGLQQNIIKINPNTDTATLFSRGDAVAGRYYGGALADNGKIYFCPFSRDQVLVLDPSTDTTYAIPGVEFTNANANGQWGWFVKGGNGKLYACPRYDNRILVVDPSDDSLSYISDGVLAGDRKYCGGAVGANGDIYFVPRSATTCMALNTDTGIARTFGVLPSGVDKWTWAIAKGPYVIMVPRMASDFLVIDTRDDSVHLLPSMLDATDKFVGAVEAAGDVYFIPYTSPQVGVIRSASLPG